MVWKCSLTKLRLFKDTEGKIFFFSPETVRRTRKVLTIQNFESREHF